MVVRRCGRRDAARQPHSPEEVELESVFDQFSLGSLLDHLKKTASGGIAEISTGKCMGARSGPHRTQDRAIGRKTIAPSPLAPGVHAPAARICTNFGQTAVDGMHLIEK
jgi:hypothetical protein